MVKFELPFDDKPVVCQYLTNALCLGIVQANAKMLGKDISPWLCSKFINCSHLNDSSVTARFSVQVFDGDATNDNAIRRLHYSFKPELLQKEDRLFVFIKQQLLSGHYIMGSFNEKYIPGMRAYNRYEFEHPYILMGYKEVSNKVILRAAGFLENGYDLYDIEFNDYVKSMRMSASCQDEVAFDTFEYLDSKEYVVNYSRVIRVFEDYIISENNMRNENPPDEVYGLSAIRSLSLFLDEQMRKEDGYFDVRYSRGLSDSKKLTAASVKYLIDYFGLEEKEYVNMAQTVVQKAERIHLLGLKFNITKDIKLASRISLLFDEIIDIETEYMPCFLRDLKAVKHFPKGTYIGVGA